MKINKAAIFASALSIAVLIYIVIWQIVIPDIFIKLYLILPIGLMAVLAFIYTHELIGEIKVRKHGVHGTPNKPTIAPEPKYKVPVPPKFKP